MRERGSNTSRSESEHKRFFRHSGFQLGLMPDDREPTELVQHFAYKGNSHRRRDAARHKTDLVWQYPSLSQGDGGGYQLFY